MLRCFSSLGCPRLRLHEIIALARRHRISAVELRSVAGTMELPEYFTAEFGSPESLRQRMYDFPVRVVALDTSLKIIGGTEADREKFLAFIPWAEAIGAQRLRVFDGGKLADEREITEAVETVRWWQSTRRTRGWRADIMVETHDALTNTPALLQFVAAAPDVAVLWDTHHTWKKAGEDPVATWKAIRGHVVHIHIKDSISMPSARHPFTYVLPGSGEFPIAPLLGALAADGFTGPVSLEWEKVWHPYLPELDDALNAAASVGWW